MFRELRRKKQALTQEECIAILRNEKRGVLCVLGDEDYPYGVPIDYVYCEESGMICFHGSKAGHKIDAIKKHDKVSFCVYDEGYRNDGEWFLNFKSVIVFGRIQIVENHERTLEICRRMTYKFISNDEYTEEELRKYGNAVQCLELIPEHISGKTIREK